MNERSIFIEALDKDPAQRSDYLDQACAGDADLRHRVEALLDSHLQAGSFLGQPVPDRLAGHLAPNDLTAQTEGTHPPGDYNQALSFLIPSDKPGSLGRLAHYEVQSIIGRGGMGIVLASFDEKLHRTVAIKVMTPTLAANEHARRRFIREGRAAAAVRDDHVIGIHGVDEASGLPFLVMEYILGRSLADRLASEGPLPVPDILRIGSQIARGLAAAHAQGLVHRDIKPANVLLENGVERVKITDFGLAHAVDDVRATQPGVVLGTPEYMSPEQARGESVDHRSDLFSLGCVLYAMCAGRPPFRAESTVAVIRRVCEDTPRPLSEINPDTPAWLANIIDKLIAKQPSERFQSSAEVAELLEQCLAHVQQSGAGVPPAIVAGTLRVPSHRTHVHNNRPLDLRSWHLASHHRQLIAVSILLALTAGLALAESTGVTNVTATVIRIVRGDGTLVVEVDDPNIQVLIDGQELVITGAGPKELRLRPGQHQLHALKDGKPIETKLVTITRDGRQVVKVAREASVQAAIGLTARLVWSDYADDVSADGRYLAFTDWTTGNIAIRDIATGENRAVTTEGSWDPFAQFGEQPRFSADGEHLAYAWLTNDKYELRVIPTSGGQPRVLLAHKDKSFTFPYGWTVDGRSILVGTYLGERLKELSLIDAVDGNHRTVKALDIPWRANVGPICISPNSKIIAYSRPTASDSQTRDIFLTDVESGQEIPFANHTGAGDVLAWTPDSRHLLFTIERQGIRDAWAVAIVDGKPQGPPQIVKPNIGKIDPLRITAQGALFYYHSPDGAVRMPTPRGIFLATVDFENGTGTAAPLPAELYSIRDQFYSVAWSKDGEHLSYVVGLPGEAQQIRVLTVKIGAVRSLQPNYRRVAEVTWAPDGRWLLCAAQQEPGQLGFYRIDAATGEAKSLLEYRGPGNPIARPTWSPDGRGIYYAKSIKDQNGTILGSTLIHRDLESQQERELFQPTPRYSITRLSPDGRLLAGFVKKAEGQGNEILELIDMERRTSRELLKIPRSSSQRGLTWTPDGRFIAYIQYRGAEKNRGVFYMAPNGNQPRRLIISGLDGNAIHQVAVHPDGKRMALTVSPPNKYETWVMENFLPPLKESKTAATGNTSAK